MTKFRPKAATAGDTYSDSKRYQIYRPDKDGLYVVADYRRVSEFIKGLDTPADSYNLDYRDRRYVAKGIAVYFADEARGLDLEEPGDKQAFNKLVDRAKRKAGIWDAAEYGTGVHAWTEDVDNGFVPETPLNTVLDPSHEDYGPAVKALKWGEVAVFKRDFKHIRQNVMDFLYLKKAHGVTFTKIESLVVLDDYRVAGKLDRLGNVAKYSPAYHCDKPHVMDTKTGRVDMGRRTKKLQFGCYATGKLYDEVTYERRDSGACTKMAYIIHLPAFKAEPTLIPVPLTDIHEDLKLCHQVWERHSVQHRWKAYGVNDWLTEHIRAVVSEKELEELWQATQVYWNTDHSQLAQQKVTEF